MSEHAPWGPEMERLFNRVAEAAKAGDLKTLRESVKEIRATGRRASEVIECPRRNNGLHVAADNDQLAALGYLIGVLDGEGTAWSDDGDPYPRVMDSAVLSQSWAAADLLWSLGHSARSVDIVMGWLDDRVADFAIKKYSRRGDQKGQDQ